MVPVGEYEGMLVFNCLVGVVGAPLLLFGGVLNDARDLFWFFS